MQNDEEIIESLIAEGLIGAALGALLSNNKNNGNEIGAIAGAIIATYKASEKAKKANVPVYIKENGMLYEIAVNGERRFIKHLEPNGQMPKNYKLK